jgi:hypothetical protein
MKNFTRDNKTKAILNTDVEALNKYKIERTYYRKVDLIQKDIHDIKKSIVSIWAKIEELENK